MSKSVAQIIDEASDDQIRSWHESVKKLEWPKDMPIPQESFEGVWQKLHKKFNNLHVSKSLKK